MAGPMKAEKAQVQQMLKDIRRAYMMKRAELRQQAYNAERELAARYAAEMNRRAAEYGYTTNIQPIGSQGGNPIGWTRGFMVDPNL